MEKEMIQYALQQWMNDEGLSLSAIGEMVGASHTSVKRWLEGTKIRKRHWEKIRPYLEKYFSDKVLEKNVPFEIKEAYELLKRTLSNKHLTWLATQNLRNIVNTFDAISEERPKAKEPKYIEFEVAETNNIPYIDQEISAGSGIEISDKTYHGLKDMHISSVKGDSMKPTYNDREKVIVQLFPKRIQFGDEFIPVDAVKKVIPEDTIIVYDLNGTGLSMKRAKYKQSKNTWLFTLVADNEEWSEEFNYPKVIKKSDDFVIYGKVIGKE